jgi:hypothetical protein
VDAAVAGVVGTLAGAGLSGFMAFLNEQSRWRWERRSRWAVERRILYSKVLLYTYEQWSATNQGDLERLRNREMTEFYGDVLLIGSKRFLRALDGFEFKISRLMDDFNSSEEGNRRDDAHPYWEKLQEVARSDLNI